MPWGCGEAPPTEDVFAYGPGLLTGEEDPAVPSCGFSKAQTSIGCAHFFLWYNGFRISLSQTPTPTQFPQEESFVSMPSSRRSLDLAHQSKQFKIRLESAHSERPSLQLPGWGGGPLL